MRLVVRLSEFNSIYYHRETYCVNWIKKRDFRLAIETFICINSEYGSENSSC